ncbi:MULTISPECIES: SDR family NAD(P)-dependent oxidoreductase [unclassified Desulfovibrio]|uniref:SDR family oxidoreductase n=1 Tax=unclassified Desulfovibrio TaxID=2593640 RepID=UPI0013EA6C74|nr:MULTISPECIES: SDR family NAD(P)-dependent oxidoreductase [unclassified Desulfovibrio]
MKGAILCIGVGPGIGFNTAMRFALEGYTPILAARNTDKLKEFAAAISEKTGRKCQTESMDAGHASSVAALIEKYGSETEILFYNAAILRPQSIFEATDASLENDVAVDLTGAMISIRNILPFMREKGHGSIFLTGGVLALFPSPEYLVLSAGKAGIRSLCQALFDNLRELNIHIGSIQVRKEVQAAERDPQKIAELFWKMFSQPKEKWTWEETYG